jgi:hypothetical protein
MMSIQIPSILVEIHDLYSDGGEKKDESAAAISSVCLQNHFCQVHDFTKDSKTPIKNIIPVERTENKPRIF